MTIIFSPAAEENGLKNMDSKCFSAMNTMREIAAYI